MPESGSHRRLSQSAIVVCLECSRRHMPEGFEPAPVIVPVHPGRPLSISRTLAHLDLPRSRGRLMAFAQITPSTTRTPTALPRSSRPRGEIPGTRRIVAMQPHPAHQPSPSDWDSGAGVQHATAPPSRRSWRRTLRTPSASKCSSYTRRTCARNHPSRRPRARPPLRLGFTRLVNRPEGDRAHPREDRRAADVAGPVVVGEATKARWHRDGCPARDGPVQPAAGSSRCARIFRWKGRWCS